jgi:hypothetical protein
VSFVMFLMLVSKAVWCGVRQECKIIL